MKHTLQSMALLATMLLVPLAVAAAEHSGEPGLVVEDAAISLATVVAIDKKTREVTLRGPGGDEVTFTAGPEVSNFAEIKRGDRVMVSFFEGVVVALGPKGSVIKKRDKNLAMARAKPGEEPAAMVTGSTAAVGAVKSIDFENRTVTMEGAEDTVVLEVAKEVDLSQLKAGEADEALYIESYAVRVVPAPKVSGTVEVESKSVAIGVGVRWGNGTLTMYDGTTHKFEIDGLSVVDLGVSKISATGEVFNLVEAKDLNGTFTAGEAGVAFVKGGSAVTMKNDKGVVVQLKSTQKGVKLSLAGGGLKVKLVE